MVRKLRQINESLIGYEPEGREFESLRAHHTYLVVAEIPIAGVGLFALQRRKDCDQD